MEARGGEECWISKGTDRPTEPTGLKKKKGTKKVGCMNACVPGGNRVTGFTFFCIAVVPLTRVLLTVDFAGGWAPLGKVGRVLMG